MSPYNLAQSRRRSCKRKIAYASKEAAESAANAARRSGAAHITVYKCPNRRTNTHWHWGHNPKHS